MSENLRSIVSPKQEFDPEIDYDALVEEAADESRKANAHAPSPEPSLYMTAENAAQVIGELELRDTQPNPPVLFIEDARGLSVHFVRRLLSERPKVYLTGPAFVHLAGPTEIESDQPHASYVALLVTFVVGLGLGLGTAVYQTLG